MGQNNRRYGKVGFKIPEKGRRWKRWKIFVNGIYIISAEERKGGNYLKNKSIFFLRRRKKRKIFREGNYSFSEEKEKVGNIWRRQIFFWRRRRRMKKKKVGNISLRRRRKNF